MGELAPPDPPLTGDRTALRQFRVDDAAAIAESCQDPDIPRFTMMPEAMTEAQARRWVEQGLEWWPHGLARFAVTMPPSDECVGQVGLQFEFAAHRAEAFYWLDRRVRGRGVAGKC
jgi:RimJ/RimL family protein N-acetyltransferase